MIVFLQTIGIQQQFQNKVGGIAPDKEAIQEIAGTLVGEYYQDKNGFAQNHALVKEIQKDLVKLGYNLGKSGKDRNGVDGDLGAKTILALHNFEQDHAEEMKAAADIQESIRKGWKR